VTCGLENALAIRSILRAWQHMPEIEDQGLEDGLNVLERLLPQLERVICLASDLAATLPEETDPLPTLEDREQLETFIAMLEADAADSDGAVANLLFAIGSPDPIATEAELNEIDHTYAARQAWHVRLRRFLLQLRRNAKDDLPRSVLLGCALDSLATEEQAAKLIRMLVVDARPHSLDVALAVLSTRLSKPGAQ
jgi:hypothetical protein